MKPNDLQGSWADEYCHSRIDGRTKCEISREELRLAHAEGVFRTLDTLIREGILKI